jgi:serine/threonine protein kinase
MSAGSVSLPGVDVSLAGLARFQPESLLGTVVAGRYRLAGHLASGGMAAVYVAEDTRDRCEVALKVLQPHLAGSPEAVRRFLCEGAIAGMIDHQNVVRILDHGAEGGTCFIAMELLEGEGLFNRLRRVGELPPAEVVAILLQVCSGLEAAHRQGVVHRDLKPENIFLHQPRSASPVVKIIDFGVAGGTHGEGSDAGLVVGTPEYLSPEQAFGKPADARSDVYSVGVMAWRMLVGRPPFTAESAESLIRMQAREPVPSITAVRPDLGIPPELVAVVARACAKDPAERPPSAAALALDLAGALRGPVSHPTPMPRPAFRAPDEVTGQRPPPKPVRSGASTGRNRFLRVLAILAFVLALAVGGAAAYLHAPSAPAAGARTTAPAR